MSTYNTNAKRKERVNYINKLIADGDKRSFNAIDAQIELVNWNENPMPRLRNHGFGNISNNRKATRGRKIQVVQLKTGGSKQIRTNV